MDLMLSMEEDLRLLRAEMTGFMNRDRPGRRSAWLYSHYVRIYLRHGMHVIGQEAYRTIDLANIEVVHDMRRKGMCRTALQYVQELCPVEAVFVENVLNPYLKTYLWRLVSSDPHWVEVGRLSAFAWIKDAPSSR